MLFEPPFTNDHHEGLLGIFKDMGKVEKLVGDEAFRLEVQKLPGGVA